MLIFLSSQILILLSLYGVVIPVAIRHVVPRMKSIPYLDEIGLQLRKESAIFHFKGEIYPIGNFPRPKINIKTEKNTLKVYHGTDFFLDIPVPVIDIHFQPGRFAIEIMTEVRFVDPIVIDTLIVQLQNGTNFNVSVAGHIGLAIFGLPTFSSTFIERIILHSNVDLTGILNSIGNGTFVPPKVDLQDPTNTDGKPMLPKMDIPKLKSVAIYLQENEIGLDVGYEWNNTVITTEIKDVKMNLTLNQKVIGGVFLRNLNLSETILQQNTQLGIYYSPTEDSLSAIQNAFSQLMHDFSLDIGIAGPIIMTTNEPVSWLKNATNSLDLNIHLDFLSLIQNSEFKIRQLLAKSFDSAPQRDATNSGFTPAMITIQTIEKSIKIKINSKVPSFMGSFNPKQLHQIKFTVKYIQEFCQLSLNKFKVSDNELEFESAIDFKDSSDSLAQLLNLALGLSNRQDPLVLQFKFPAFRNITSINLDIANMSGKFKEASAILIDILFGVIKAPTFDFSSDSGSEQNSKKKLLKFHLIQENSLMHIDLAIELDLHLPVDFFLGYLTNTLKLNYTKLLKIELINLKYSKSILSLTLNILPYDNSNLKNLIERIIKEFTTGGIKEYFENTKDMLSLSNLRFGESKSVSTNLLSDINLSIPVSLIANVLSKIKTPKTNIKFKLPPLENFYHILTPTWLTFHVKSSIYFVFSSLFRNPILDDFKIKLQNITIKLDTLELHLISFEISDVLTITNEIKIGGDNLSPLLNLANNNIDVHFSLKMGQTSIFDNLNIKLPFKLQEKLQKLPKPQLPQISILDIYHVLRIVNFEKLNLFNPFANFRFKHFTLLQSNLLISTTLDINLKINIPISIYISKVALSSTLQRIPFITLEIDKIQFDPNISAIKLQTGLSFSDCNPCQINQDWDKMLNHSTDIFIGLTGLTIGDIHAFESLTLTLPTIKNSSGNKSSINDVRKIVLNDKNSMSFHFQFSNPLSSYISVHFQKISLVFGMNNEELLKFSLNEFTMNANSTVIDTRISFSGSKILPQTIALSKQNKWTPYFTNLTLDTVRSLQKIKLPQNSQ